MSIKIEQTDIGVEDWIDGATFVQVKVEIHRNRALWADLKPLYEQIAAAEERLAALQAAARGDADDESSLGEAAAAPRNVVGEESLGEHSEAPATVRAAQAELDELLGQAQELYARYDADKETWTLRGLEDDELRQIVAEVREEVGHGDPPRRRSKETAKAFAGRVAKWQQVMTEQVKPEVDVRSVAKAVVAVEVAGEPKPAPSVDGIRRLRARPHGKEHFAELLAALEAITLQEVAIPAPHR